MIVRVFRAVVHAARRAEFEDFFRNTAIPPMRAQDGLLSLTAGLPRPETPDEFCMVMVWRDVTALAAFAGPDWRQPHIDPSGTGVAKERHLHHYELSEA